MRSALIGIMKRKKSIHLHLVSDATGETTHGLARAALGQFPDAMATEHVWTLVRTRAHLDAVDAMIAEVGGLVFFSVSNPEIRRALEEICIRHQVPHLGILDHAVHILAQKLGKPASNIAGGQHRMDEAYFERMEALEFAVHHDDGQAMDTLKDADILLVGVSRSSKTPTAIYLANRGYKVANYPLVPGIAPPLEQITKHRIMVIGLIKEARRLSQIRKNRLESMKDAGNVHYADIRAINDELSAARRLFQAQNWPMIDVSRKSIEETAAEIINLYQVWRETHANN